jgi:CheY-like chemotaxis protein
MNIKLQTIVAAEDEESDRFILNLAFQRAKLPQRLVMVRNGRECVDYLGGLAPYDDRVLNPVPVLLLLDLKMPVMDGFEVLTWLATQPDLKHLPAIVFSSSSYDSDIEKAQQLGARDYFVKPLDLSDLVGILQNIQSKWLSLANAGPEF